VAAVPKMLFPFLVTVPGLCAAVVLGDQLATDYNSALPLLLDKYYGPGLLGLGLTALLASFMSGMAGNITALNTVWTYDLYQNYIRPGQSDAHYLAVGRATTVIGTVVSIATAYIVLRFDNLMDYMQLICSFFLSPLFATFLLGMFWKRSNASGAFYGMIAGIAGATGHYGAYRVGWLHYSADMAPNFYGAMYGWTCAMVVTIGVSLATPPPAAERLAGLVYTREGAPSDSPRPVYTRVEFIAVCILLAAFVLNVVFW
jgi:SSS family solute:Na+ symporter